MKILIPAKGKSSRIKDKNIQIVGGRPLVAWAIRNARTWFPDADVYVATEDMSIGRYALRQGCLLYPLTDDDVEDRRRISGIYREFYLKYRDRPLICMQPSSPFTFKHEVLAALTSGKNFLKSAWMGVLHTRDVITRLSQDVQESCVYTGNFRVLNSRICPAEQDWNAPENVGRVSWISSIDINTPEDLELAQWLGQRVSPEDFDT